MTDSEQQAFRVLLRRFRLRGEDRREESWIVTKYQRGFVFGNARRKSRLLYLVVSDLTSTVAVSPFASADEEDRAIGTEYEKLVSTLRP